jgi:hypothetical protein
MGLELLRVPKVPWGNDDDLMKFCMITEYIAKAFVKCSLEYGACF